LLNPAGFRVESFRLAQAKLPRSRDLPPAQQGSIQGWQLPQLLRFCAGLAIGHVPPAGCDDDAALATAARLRARRAS